MKDVTFKLCSCRLKNELMFGNKYFTHTNILAILHQANMFCRNIIEVNTSCERPLYMHQCSFVSQNNGSLFNKLKRNSSDLKTRLPKGKHTKTRRSL